MAQRGYFKRFDAAQCLAEISEVGACTVPNFIEDELRFNLLEEVNGSDLVPEPEVYGKYSTKQKFSALRTFKPGSLFPSVAADLRTVIEGRFLMCNPSPMKTGLHFNDLVVQRYQPGPLGISPHRDSRSCINLIALLVLEGKGRFCLCADRDGNKSQAMRNRPGDLLLMRGPGFLGEVVQPFHFVDTIETQRTTFALRQKIAA